MRESYYIVTMDIYIGHNPFDDENAANGLDIQTVCKSLDDAHTYIDRSIAQNMEAHDRESGKRVITCRVDKPEFFEGREVDVYFTDTRDDKKWMWVFSIYERPLFDPEEKEVINEDLRSVLNESIEEMRLGHYITHEEFKREMETWLKEEECKK